MNFIQMCVFFLITSGFSSESIETSKKPILLRAIGNLAINEFQVVKSSRQNSESKIQINPNYIEKDTLNPQLFPPKAQID